MHKSFQAFINHSLIRNRPALSGHSNAFPYDRCGFSNYSLFGLYYQCVSPKINIFIILWIVGITILQSYYLGY